MAAGQIFCFACGARPSEHAPHPGVRVGWAVLLGLAFIWLLTLTVVVVPVISGRSWRALLSGTGRSDADVTRGGPDKTSQTTGLAGNDRLQFEYEHRVNMVLRAITRLRRHSAEPGRADSLAGVLDWAEAQLEATRRIASVLPAISDSEAVSDVEQFLDGRLERVQLRLDELRR